jgi:formylmethanofuran dehydrogenase subunit B
MASQEVGIPTCTVGQIRHRADLSVDWSCNPWASHPRHFERYTAFAEGRFEKSEWKNYLKKLEEESGRKRFENVKQLTGVKYVPHTEVCTVQAPRQKIHKMGRKIMVLDTIQTMTSKAADYFVPVEQTRTMK